MESPQSGRWKNWESCRHCRISKRSGKVLLLDFPRERVFPSPFTHKYCYRAFFALVDLKEFVELPDVFIVPSNLIAAYFEGGDPQVWRRARYHTENLEELSQYKENWDILHTRLKELSGFSPSPP